MEVTNADQSPISSTPLPARPDRSGRLRRFLELLQLANMPVDVAVSRGYEFALAILMQEVQHGGGTSLVFDADRMEQAAEMLATVAGEMGLGMHPWLWPENLREARCCG